MPAKRRNARVGSNGYVVGGYLVDGGLREAKKVAQREANLDRRPIRIEDNATQKTVATVYPKRSNPKRKTTARRKSNPTRKRAAKPKGLPIGRRVKVFAKKLKNGKVEIYGR